MPVPGKMCPHPEQRYLIVMTYSKDSKRRDYNTGLYVAAMRFLRAIASQRHVLHEIHYDWNSHVQAHSYIDTAISAACRLLEPSRRIGDCYACTQRNADRGPGYSHANCNTVPNQYAATRVHAGTAWL